jgi:hypothetical protein
MSHILSQISLVHKNLSYRSEVHFNVILPLTIWKHDILAGHYVWDCYDAMGTRMPI